MNHLTPSERAAYSNGAWLADLDLPRCKSCGCLRDNHAALTAESVGQCLVCSCEEYVERDDDQT